MYYYWDDEKISEHGETLIVTLLRRIEDLQVRNKNCNQELEQAMKDLTASKAELAALKSELARLKDGEWK